MNVFSAAINVRQTGTTSADEPVWAARHSATSTKLITITKIYCAVSFDGTAAASTSRYSIERFQAATHTGGTAITAALKGSGQAATQMTDIRFLDTGLTDTSVTLLGEFAIIGCPRGATGQSVPFVLMRPIVLNPGEGLQITLQAAAVIGDGLGGYVEWDEQNQGS